MQDAVIQMIQIFSFIVRIVFQAHHENYSTNQTEFCLTTQGFALFQFKVAVITEDAQTRYQV